MPHATRSGENSLNSRHTQVDNNIEAFISGNMRYGYECRAGRVQDISYCWGLLFLILLSAFEGGQFPTLSAHDKSCS